MNLFVADPQWGWWIVWYFFLGGIAAGAYFTAALIDILGQPDDRALSRIGYLIAFPLVLLCGLFLTLDLERPERFWHMLWQSEVVHQALEDGWPWTGAGWSWMVQAPMLKYWSPMSIGAWALSLFGLCSFLSFLGSLWPGRRLARRRRQGWLGRPFLLLGSGLGFFVASYTGVLLSATNQPLWSQSDWVAPLFLASAASTGLATILLLVRLFSSFPEMLNRLEKAKMWTLVLELIVFLLFFASMGPLLPVLWSLGLGKLLILGPLAIGLLLPLVIHFVFSLPGRVPTWTAPAFVLVGGFLLRYALLLTPADLLATSPDVVGPSPTATVWFPLSPEDGRQRGGGVGASDCNRAGAVQPRSKITGTIMP